MAAPTISATRNVNGVDVPLTPEELAAQQAESDANYYASIAQAQAASAKTTITSKPVVFDGHVSASPTIVATGLSLVVGHWLATWTNGHDGGNISVLARGGSLTLTGGQTDSLTLSLDNNGNLTLRKIGLRDYLASLNLLGR